MQKPSKHHKLTSDNNIIKFKKPVPDPFKASRGKKTEKHSQATATGSSSTFEWRKMSVVSFTSSLNCFYLLP